MKRILPFLLAAGVISLAVGAVTVNNQSVKKAEAVSGQPGFTHAASYTRPMHFSDPLTNDGNATYGSKYLNCYLSVDRTDTGLDFDLMWTENTINEHSWFTIVLGDTSAKLYDNPAMDANYDKFMIKPVAGLWAYGAPGVVKSPTSKTFYDWPVANDGWVVNNSYNYDAANKNVTFHVDYSDLNTMSSKTDDAHIYAIQFYHDVGADPAVDNCLMGANPWWQATDINGTCSGDINLMNGNPLISQCDPDLAISEFAPTHTWSVGAKYGTAGCYSYDPHAATNEYYCEISRDDVNKELILDVHSAGTMEVANSGTLYKDIEFIFTPTSSNLGGWNINASDLVARVYRKSASEMFADVVTGDLVNVWTTSASELFPHYAEKTYNYADHVVASPKSATAEDTAFGTHFRIVYDLNDADLSLLTGDFKVEGIPFTGTDGVWGANQIWNLGGNEYFGSSISDTGDMAAQASYIPINSNYFAVQDALHYYFNNVSRDANHSMCSILSDSTRLSAVTSWYAGLSSNVVDKLAITPDHRVTVKNTLDYIMVQANVSNPHALGMLAIANNSGAIIVLTIIAVISISGISGYFFFKKKIHR